MLDAEEYEKLCLNLNWTGETLALVNRIRNSDPVRLVRGGRGNVRGRYPSRKMGCVIQFESHTCELPCVLDMEYYQEDVLEYWDQPISFIIRYKNKNGRNIGTTHTPDFFVIRETYAEFVECKTEEELVKLANAQPGKYYLGKDGRWRCPPGEEYAAQYGFKFTVVSTAEIDRVHTRNTVFLEDFLGKNCPLVSPEQREMIVALVTKEPGVLLSDLLERVLEAGGDSDSVYTLIARGEIFVNLRAEALAERDRVWVYPDNDSAQKNTCPTPHVLRPKGKFIEPTEGTRILFNDSVLSIVFVGDSKIFFEGERGARPCISFSHFEELVKKGEIRGIDAGPEPDPDSRWKEIWNNVKPKRREQAARRNEILQCHFDKRPLPPGVQLRTVARWKSKYKAAERAYGNGLVGLLPCWDRCGDRLTVKLHPDARRIMLEAITDEYETIVRKGKYVVWSMVVERCEKIEVKHPSYTTFVQYVRRRPEYLQVLKRMGHRAAYALKPFYFRLGPDTPRHGDRPFEICHIDHTELDIELIDPRDGTNLGRPWATFMIDACSRRILAIYLTFDPPSDCSNMMVIRDCVRRHGRLPQTIVVDGGADFHSVYFETLAAAFEITVKTRPAAEPRFGSVIERLFHTTNKQFVHNLIGNTQITRNVRQMTKGNDPKRLAVWSLGHLYQALCDWAFNKYDTEEHRTLKQSPRNAYFSGLRLTGVRHHRLISYDEEFRILTMPAVKKGTAKNIAGRGVKIKNKYYRCEELYEPEFEGENLPARYDPFNYGFAYVYLKDRWVKCFSDNFHELEGRTEREQMLMSAEESMRERRYSRGATGRALKRAREHREDMEREKAQSEQLRLVRKRKAENTVVLEVINGGLSDNVGRQLSGEEVAGRRRTSGPRRDASPFKKIDWDKLETLEAYKK